MVQWFLNRGCLVPSDNSSILCSCGTYVPSPSGLGYSQLINPDSLELERVGPAQEFGAGHLCCKRTAVILSKPASGEFTSIGLG